MQQVKREGRPTTTGKTRYVFAGSASQTDSHTKVCPRCGQLLFDDMDVCYGCLYDFSRDRHGSTRDPTAALEALPQMRQRSVPKVGDPLDSIELDEIDDEEERRVPRHRKQPTSAGDTVDLSAAASAAEAQPDAPVDRGDDSHTGLAVLIASSEMQVCVPLGERGLSVGRDRGSDVVLLSPSVSRRHLRMQPDGEGLVVEDLGATNPAVVHGRPLEGTATLRVGEQVVVCGTTFTLCRAG